MELNKIKNFWNQNASKFEFYQILKLIFDSKQQLNYSDAKILIILKDHTVIDSIIKAFLMAHNYGIIEIKNQEFILANYESTEQIIIRIPSSEFLDYKVNTPISFMQIVKMTTDLYEPLNKGARKIELIEGVLNIIKETKTKSGKLNIKKYEIEKKSTEFRLRSYYSFGDYEYRPLPIEKFRLNFDYSIKFKAKFLISELPVIYKLAKLDFEDMKFFEHADAGIGFRFSKGKLYVLFLQGILGCGYEEIILKPNKGSISEIPLIEYESNKDEKLFETPYTFININRLKIFEAFDPESIITFHSCFAEYPILLDGEIISGIPFKLLVPPINLEEIKKFKKNASLQMIKSKNTHIVERNLADYL